MMYRLALPLLGLVLACASPPTERPQPGRLRSTTGDLAAAARGAQAFALHPRARIVRPMEGRSDTELREVVDTTLTAVLRDKGYDLAEAGDSTLAWAYAVGASDTLSDAELVELFDLAAGLDTTGHEPRAGFVLALVDLTSGEVLWRGSSSAPWDRKLRPANEVATALRSALDRLLADLPRRW